MGRALSAVAAGLVGSRAVLECRGGGGSGRDPAGMADGLDRLADSGVEGASAVGGVVQVGDAAWLVTADPVTADTACGFWFWGGVGVSGSGWSVGGDGGGVGGLLPGVRRPVG